MTKVIAYLRVSTEEQATQGVSLDAQMRKCQQWVELNAASADVHFFIDDGISGKATHNRPNFNQGMENALRFREGGQDVIFLVYKLDRFSRSTKDTIEKIEELDAAGIDFVSVLERFDTTTSHGRFFTTVIAALAQLEREQISERTKTSLAHMRSQGRVTGTPPYGFKSHDGQLVLAGDEQEGLGIILEAARGEQVSFAGVAKRLNDAGIQTRSGGKWDRGVVRRMILFYQGEVGHEILRRLEDD